jgi:hypothetical protein
MVERSESGQPEETSKRQNEKTTAKEFGKKGVNSMKGPPQSLGTSEKKELQASPESLAEKRLGLDQPPGTTISPADSKKQQPSSDDLLTNASKTSEAKSDKDVQKLKEETAARDEKRLAELRKKLDEIKASTVRDT